MFYQTFSGTLGFAVAIGFIFVCILLIINKIRTKGNEKGPKSKLNTLNLRKVNKISTKFLVCFFILFSLGFVSSCASQMSPTDGLESGLFSNSTMSILFIVSIIFFFIKTLTEDVRLSDYNIFKD